MKTDLENQIRENRSVFDNSSPDEGHLERFISKLEMAEKAKSRTHFISVLIKSAAAILILAIVSYVGFFELNIFKNTRLNQSQVYTIEYSEEMMEIFTYYETTSNNMLDKISSYTSDSAEARKIREMAQLQLENLDANMAKIEKEYVKNPENKELSAALINNKRKKVEIIEQIIRQIDISNKELF
jgi:hypothetical protein